MAQKRENKIVSPSVPVNMRAFIVCDPNEFMVVAAIQAIHWVKDADEEAGLEMLCQAIPKVSRRTIQRALDGLKKQGLVRMDRGYGRPSTFALTFDDLTFSDFRAILQPRQVGIDDGAKLAQTSRQVGADISSTDSKSIDSKEETTPQAVEVNEDKAIQDKAWDALKAVWSKKHPTAPPLKWPAATMRGWASLLISEAKRLGVPELERRWSNMVNDDFSVADLRDFIRNTDKWQGPPRKKGAAPGARQFHQPPVTEHAPTLKVPPHE